MSTGSAPDPDARADEPAHNEWLQPPPLTLGAIIPMNAEVARTHRGAIALVEARSFPTGCQFELIAGVEKPRDESTLQQIWRLYADPRPAPASPPDELLDVAVVLPDGKTASILDRVPRRLPPTVTPDPPVMVVRSGRVSEVPGDSWLQLNLNLWLWPLPPPEEFHLTLEYPLMDLPLTRVEMDGDAIVAAAQGATTLIRHR